MRIGEVDVAAPDPAPAHLRLGTYEPRGLGIVDDEKVLYKFHAPPVLLVIGHEDVLDLLRQVVIAAMQRVVKTLGHFVEVIAAGDDLHLVGTSSSFISGTRRFRISATPPPTAVELTILTVLPWR